MRGKFYNLMMVALIRLLLLGQRDQKLGTHSSKESIQAYRSVVQLVARVLLMCSYRVLQKADRSTTPWGTIRSIVNSWEL